MSRLAPFSPSSLLRTRWCRTLSAGAALLLLAVAAAGPSQGGDAADEFLAKHWQLPVPPQGEAPEGFSAVEASLNPDQCGICHPVQHNGWKTSIHAGAASSGLLGQLVDVVESAPGFVANCLTCHAPLSEQSPKSLALQDSRKVYQSNPDFDPELRGRGVVCAACHVRAHRRFGPPPRKPIDPEKRLPHNGFTVEEAFLKAEFCRRCHQHPPQVAINGKPIMNTYNEWKEGPYAAEGVQCQDCHMPDRQHLWRGIHDPEMVRRGVQVGLEARRRQEGSALTVEAALVVRNVGVGHYFPTYSTPSVLLQMRLLNGRGEVVQGTEKEEVIGRELILTSREWREAFDTRVPPRGEHRFTYSQPAENDGWRLEAIVTVRPDYFYFNFYNSVLQQGRSDESRRLLEAARENASSSPFEIFHETLSLVDLPD